MTLETLLEWVQQGFLDALTTVVDIVTGVIGVLPNPDPFPDLITQLDTSGNAVWMYAAYYLNQFVDVGMCSALIAGYFSMFASAWLIMTLWKWAKAR